MAYLALYRKWRPRTFTEVVGQKHISIPLQRAIEQDRLAHAYLFSGPRGTGKTSMAKILAKAVNCLHPNGVNPCNECQSCREINAGSSLDVYEIDAASNRGIEEIRALRESVRTLPAVSRKKVYIIDEVHMLTKEAFNALLKTLEEPPSHVLFILATTEPEKIPLTILSRCQRYEFHRISVEDIKNHLLYIAKESHLPLTEEAADLIAVRADGGLRDALSLLDQCSSASESKVLDAPAVYDLLGLTGKDMILDLSHHNFNGDSSSALSLFYRILQGGKEPASILRDLLEHFRNLMICKVNPKAPEFSQYGSQVETLRSDASRLPAPYLDALFDYLHEALHETKRSSSPRLSAEMGLLHLINKVYGALADFGLGSSDVLIALGGRVVGDITGFTAATWHRGISYIQFPTSVLSQIGSSIGGKITLDLDQGAGKNAVGTFYQPKGVFVDPGMAKTLPRRYFHNGLGDAVKLGCVADKNLFELFEKVSSDTEIYRVLPEIIRRCVTIKAHYVEIDPLSKGERRILDFGHTIGGAIERCYRYNDARITHGEATAIGIYLITRRSELEGLTKRGTTSRLEYVLKSLSLPISTSIPDDILFESLKHDKKIKGDVIQITLIKEIGEGFLYTIPVKELGKFIRK